MIGVKLLSRIKNEEGETVAFTSFFWRCGLRYSTEFTTFPPHDSGPLAVLGHPREIAQELPQDPEYALTGMRYAAYWCEYEPSTEKRRQLWNDGECMNLDDNADPSCTILADSVRLIRPVKSLDEDYEED